jgi:hypothetical protein
VLIGLPSEVNMPDSYDEWFRKKVQNAIDGLENGTNEVISEEEWNEIVAAKKAQRDALQRPLAGKRSHS